MFSKLIENPQMDLPEQKQIIKNILQNNLKKNLPEVRLQFNHNYESIKPILINHWKYALRLALSLSTWQLTKQFFQNKIQNPTLDLLNTICKNQQSKSLAEYVLTELSKTYADHWRQLIILKLAAQILIKRIQNTKQYTWFLANFVKISATIIQSYLTVKNQPAKTNQDRTQNDNVLMANCQFWVAKSYISLIQNLKTQIKNKDHRYTIITFFCQVCAALSQNQRIGHLNINRLQQILNASFNYIKQNFPLCQIQNLLLQDLKNKKYINRLKKIQVPQKYDENIDFAKQGIAWMLLRLLKQGQSIYSQSKILQISLIVYSEVLESPLRFKQQALIKIKQLVNKNVKISNQFQNYYPGGLLLFNVYLFQKQQLNFISAILESNNKHSNKLRRWKRLMNLDLVTLNIKKTLFVMTQLKNDEYKQKQILFLAKSITFNFVQEQVTKSVYSFAQSLLKQHGEIGKKILKQITVRQKQNRRNIQLCQQINKLINQ